MKHLFCSYCMSPVEEDGACPVCGLTAGSYQPSPHHLPPGTVLVGRYLVGRVLGEGGFGITYIGCDLRLELKVAIKEYFPTDKVVRYAQTSLEVSSYTGLAAESYQAGKRKFLTEARTMAKMDKQPEIVCVRDFFEANNTAYIVMEYVEGTNFKELVKQKGGRISPQELLPMMEPLFTALEAMHRAGLIHRDISPDNLMLEHGAVRLLDFGCARESSHGTETLTIALKHGYAPIEQYNNRGQGPWTDVYALAATLYFCLTGKAPPQATDRLFEDEIVLPRKLGVELTQQQEQALLHAMGIRPRRRYQTVEEFHAALYAPEGLPEPESMDPQPDDSAPMEPESTDVTSEEPTPAAPPPGKSPLKAVLFSLLAAAVFALAAFIYQSWPFSLLEEENPTSTAQSGASSDTGSLSSDADLTPVANPTPFTGEGIEAFSNLLADDTVSAILLEEPVALTGTEEFPALELTKPVVIGEQGALYLRVPVTVSSGGLLQIQGELSYSGLLRTQAGGRIEVAQEGNLNGDGLLWLESSADLTAAGELGTAFLRTYDLDALFSHATQVTTLEQLKDALGSGASVVIGADLTISESLSNTVPVLIPEGVTVTLQGQDTIWTTETLLVNQGTLTGHVNTWSQGFLVNQGTLQLTGSDGMWVDPYGVVLNQGAMTLEHAYSQWQRDTLLCNLGTLQIQGSSSALGLLGNAQMANFGQVTLLDGAWMESFGTLRNWGSLDVASESILENYGFLFQEGQSEILGTLRNEGLLEVGSGLLRLADEGVCEQLGVLHYNDAAQLEGTFDGSTRHLMDDYTQGGTVAGCTSEEELITLASQGNTGAIHLFGEITLTQDLTLTKGLMITEGATLRLAEGVRLTVEGAVVQNNGTLEGGALSFQSGAQYFNQGQGTLLTGSDPEISFGSQTALLNYSNLDLGGGQLSVSEDAMLINHGEISHCSTLSLTGGSVLAQNGLLSGEGMTIQVTGTDSRLLSLTGLELSRISLSLAEGGRFLSSDALSLFSCSVSIDPDSVWESRCTPLLLDGDSTLQNQGLLSVQNHANQDTQAFQLEGTLDNQGTLLFGTTPVLLRGTLDNQGTLVSFQDENGAGGIIQEADGVLTGNPVQDTLPEN